MKRNTEINIESIDKLANELKSTSENLIGTINYLKAMADELLDVYDAPTARKVQEILIDEMKKALKPCNKLLDLSNKVRLFNKNYKEVYSITQRSVGGK